MNIDKDKYLEKFKITTRKINKEKVLATDIWRFFGKKIPFSLIMFFIKRKGYKFVFEVFNELKKEGNASPRLFIWICGKQKIKWLNSENT
jgi:hypothetical protein